MVYAMQNAGDLGVMAAGEDTALARLTNTGDRSAAEVLLSRSMPTLLHLSRAIAGRTVEAEELLSTALLSTWEKWKQGRGPVENVQGYIAQAMRNRLRDEVRSPRSHNVALDPHHPDLAYAGETDRVDSAIDQAIVSVALSRLSHDQRMLLTDVVVDGRPPRAVSAELGRTSAMVSSGVYRAKVALRLEVVLECLRRSCHSEKCRAGHERVAVVVAAKTVWDAADIALADARECPGCWAGLQAYDALAGTVRSDASD
jgi:RNA polymerase sigma factor (sigma-70 family)